MAGPCIITPPPPPGEGRTPLSPLPASTPPLSSGAPRAWPAAGRRAPEPPWRAPRHPLAPARGSARGTKHAGQHFRGRLASRRVQGPSVRASRWAKHLWAPMGTGTTGFGSRRAPHLEHPGASPTNHACNVLQPVESYLHLQQLQVGLGLPSRPPAIPCERAWEGVEQAEVCTPEKIAP